MFYSQVEKSITKQFIQDFNLHLLKEYLKQHCKSLDMTWAVYMQR